METIDEMAVTNQERLPNQGRGRRRLRNSIMCHSACQRTIAERTRCIEACHRLETLRTVAAHTQSQPCPLVLAANRPGATCATSVVPSEMLPSPLVTVISAAPVVVPGGNWKLSCPGAAKKSGAARSTPALSLTTTRVPASVVGKSRLLAAAVPVASPVPVARRAPERERCL